MVEGSEANLDNRESLNANGQRAEGLARKLIDTGGVADDISNSFKQQRGLHSNYSRDAGALLRY